MCTKALDLFFAVQHGRKELVIEYVAEWRVTEVVAQTGDRHLLDFVSRDLQLGLGALQTQHHLLGQMAHAERVLESVVARSGKHEVGRAELLDVPQALELGRIDDLDALAAHAKVAMNGIVEHLCRSASISEPFADSTGLGVIVQEAFLKAHAPSDTVPREKERRAEKMIEVVRSTS